MNAPSRLDVDPARLDPDPNFEMFADEALDEDELDDPIAYRLTPLGLKAADRGMCFDEWLALNASETE